MKAMKATIMLILLSVSALLVSGCETSPEFDLETRGSNIPVSAAPAADDSWGACVYGGSSDCAPGDDDLPSSQVRVFFTDDGEPNALFFGNCLWGRNEGPCLGASLTELSFWYDDQDNLNAELDLEFDLCSSSRQMILQRR